MDRAIIFDFDGVIVHTEPLHLLACREVFAAWDGGVRGVGGVGGVHFSDEAYYTRYVAYADREVFPRIAADAGRTLHAHDLEALLEAKWQAFQRLVASHGPHPFPATLALIHDAARRAVPVALCTAAKRRDAHLVLSSLGVWDVFRVVVTADDVPRSKPDPAPYALAAQRLGLPAHACVAIEDTDGGIASARGAGCAVVGVAHTLPIERLARASRVVGSSAELTVDGLLSLAQPSH